MKTYNLVERYSGKVLGTFNTVAEARDAAKSLNPKRKRFLEPFLIYRNW
jgi:hypothetical protein